MFFVVDYYPEHWDKTKGNFNIAYIAEFLLINGCRFDGTLNPYGVEIIEYL